MLIVAPFAINRGIMLKPAPMLDDAVFVMVEGMMRETVL
jgi:hypothetical protein